MFNSTLTGKAFWVILASVTIVLIVLSLLFRYLNLESLIQDMFMWLETLGWRAPLIFIVIDMLVVIFFLPGILVTMGAGFLFGVVYGSLYVVIATTLGASIAFITSRYILYSKVSEYLNKHTRLRIIDDSISTDGWQIVLSLRLIPFFPGKLLNYVLGTTSCSLQDFISGTFLGIWPITVIIVYIGSLTSSVMAPDIARLPDTGVEWTLYISGLVFAILAAFYLGYRARKILSASDYSQLD